MDSFFAWLGLGGIGLVGLMWFLGVGTVLKIIASILEILTPIVRAALEFLVWFASEVGKRLVKEFKALFDVFPVLILLLVFTTGLLTAGYLSETSTVEKARPTLSSKVKKYLTPSLPRQGETSKKKKESEVWSPFDIPGVN